MRLDANKLFVATAITFAVIWIVCAALVVFVPAGMMSLSGHMTHMDFEGFSWTMSVTGFFVGLVTWSLMAGAIVWVIASIYNRLIG